MVGIDGDGAGCDVGEGGYPEVGSAVAAGGDLVHLGEFLAGAGQADLQSFGFADAGDQVVADFGQPRPLGGLGAQ